MLYFGSYDTISWTYEYLGAIIQYFEAATQYFEAFGSRFQNIEASGGSERSIVERPRRLEAFGVSDTRMDCTEEDLERPECP